MAYSGASLGRLSAPGAAAFPSGIPGQTGRRFQVPRVTSMACGLWAMDEDKLLWGVGLEQEFCFIGLHPVTLGRAAGDREQVTQ